MASIDVNADKFIGKGLIFPIIINSSGRPDIMGGKKLLESSFNNILSWAIGTRFFLGEYGTNLERLLQEPNDLISQNLVKHYTVDVIKLWEKRVDVLDVKLINKGDYILDIEIVYLIKSSKIQDSFIFPYYSQIKY